MEPTHARSPDARCRPRHRLHQGYASRPVPRMARVACHHQDLRGQEELLPRRQDDRVRPAARHTPNKVVLPAGYEVVGLTVPSQIITEADGRIGVSFVNGTEALHRSCSARRRAATGAAVAPKAATKQRSWESPFEGETEEDRLSERAHQDRDIVYFLQQPESHAFALYHDYTESRPASTATPTSSARAARPAIRRRASRYRRAAGGEGDERRGDGGA